MPYLIVYLLMRNPLADSMPDSNAQIYCYGWTKICSLQQFLLSLPAAAQNFFLFIQGHFGVCRELPFRPKVSGPLLIPNSDSVRSCDIREAGRRYCIREATVHVHIFDSEKANDSSIFLPDLRFPPSGNIKFQLRELIQNMF